LPIPRVDIIAFTQSKSKQHQITKETLQSSLIAQDQSIGSNAKRVTQAKDFISLFAAGHNQEKSPWTHLSPYIYTHSPQSPSLFTFTAAQRKNKSQIIMNVL
jgi:hypothetical protein